MLLSTTSEPVAMMAPDNSVAAVQAPAPVATTITAATPATCRRKERRVS
ncbi:hypothetical protein SAMN02799625_01919 [Methylobacterium sp. UNC300MFChir4.1]|nr:hypothetical protein SAMN02799625_01919 [Methylobacterium sp. UNC300MFChir4.1]